MLKTTPGFTFYDKKTGSASRLDYMLTSKMLPFILKNISIVTCTVPDHETLIACFKTTSQKRGKGYWKLNNSLLSNETYVKSIKDIIVATKHDLNDIGSYRLTWELLKIRFKEFSIKFSVSQARKANSDIVYLCNRIDNIRDKLDNTEIDTSSPYCKLLFNEKTRLETELQKMQEQKLEVTSLDLGLSG